MPVSPLIQMSPGRQRMTLLAHSFNFNSSVLCLRRRLTVPYHS
jgi:hypothetical protein